MIAHRVVAGHAQDRPRRPGAARFAHRLVIAGAAKAPGRPLDIGPNRILHRLPDLGERAMIADIAAAIFALVKRRAALDHAVGLDRHPAFGGAAAVPISRLVGHRPPEMLIGAEIADIVAREEPEAGLSAALEQPGERVVGLRDLPGLEDQVDLLGGVAGGDGELDLPQSGRRRRGYARTSPRAPAPTAG